MQKRSHVLLASALLRSAGGFPARRFELVFLFGSFQPDCNPLSYLKGSLSAGVLQGHSYPNARRFIRSRMARLRRCRRWTLWQYYTLGKLTHYLADAFTYPHNLCPSRALTDHHRYESALRRYLTRHLAQHSPPRMPFCADPAAAIEALHRQYLRTAGSVQHDADCILRASALLMAGCMPSIS